jgi:hypothetical protein
MPWPLFAWGKSPWYPLDRRLGGPQNRSGRGEEKRSLAPTGTRTPTSQPSSSQLVTIPTVLSHFPIWEEICGHEYSYDMFNFTDRRMWMRNLTLLQCSLVGQLAMLVWSWCPVFQRLSLSPSSVDVMNVVFAHCIYTQNCCPSHQEPCGEQWAVP